MGHLQSEKWEKILQTIQSIRIKKLILEIQPGEKMVLPYQEDKMFNERTIWKISKEMMVLQQMIPHKCTLSIREKKNSYSYFSDIYIIKSRYHTRIFRNPIKAIV